MGVNKIKDPLIVKAALLTSYIVGVIASTILTMQFVEFMFGIAAQTNVPEVVLYEVAIAIYVFPLSVEYKIL